MRTLIFLSLVIIADSGRNKQRTTTKKIDSSIHFPEESMEVPSKCKDSLFCMEMPENYPESEIEQLYKGKKKQLPTPKLKKFNIRPEPPKVDNKAGSDDDEEPQTIYCDSEIQFNKIYMVRKDKDSRWDAVVQLPEIEYTQSVRIEICNKPNTTCVDPDIFPHTFCRQIYSNWELLVLNEAKKPETRQYFLPTCCKCMYQNKT